MNGAAAAVPPDVARQLEVFKRGGETAEAVAQNILWELRKFVGISKRTDDVTMIVVRVL